MQLLNEIKVDFIATITGVTIEANYNLPSNVKCKLRYFSTLPTHKQ